MIDRGDALPPALDASLARGITDVQAGRVVPLDPALLADEQKAKAKQGRDARVAKWLFRELPDEQEVCVDPD